MNEPSYDRKAIEWRADQRQTRAIQRHRAADQDAGFTRFMVDAGRVLGIDVADHLIVTSSSYYSFPSAGSL